MHSRCRRLLIVAIAWAIAVPRGRLRLAASNGHSSNNWFRGQQIGPVGIAFAAATTRDRCENRSVREGT